MLKSVVRLSAGAAAAAAFAALSGCSQPPAEAPPPPPQAYQAPPPAQGLAGGPPPAAPARPAQGLAGGPRRPVVVVHMAPVANPESLTPAERARIYGPGRYTEHGGRGGAPAPTRTWRKADGTTVVAMRPVPNPEQMGPRERARVYGHQYAAAGHAGGAVHHKGPATPAPTHAATKPAPAAPVAKAPVSKPPVMTAAKPPPVVAAPPAANSVAAKPAPVVAAPPAIAAPPMDPKLAKLQAAVGPAATNGAVLTVADSIGKGQPGKVTLTLPQDLYATIKREAGKAGLAAAARKTDISAVLSGDGYTITPNGVQTVHLASGEAAKFDWLVTPGAGEKSALKAEVTALLAGAGKPQSFSLASIEQAVKAMMPEPKEKTSAFALPDWLSIPGMKDVDLPVFGKVASNNLVAIGIAVLVLLILVMVVRGSNASRAREERRKKFRTLTDYGLNSAEAEPAVQAYEPPPTPSYATFSEPAAYSPPPPPAPEAHEAPAQTNYVNPMIAAAAGAAAGAAITHAVDEHHAHAEAAAPVEHHGDHHGDHHGEHAHMEDHHGDTHHGETHHGDGHDAHADAHHDDHGHGDHGHAQAHADHHEPEHA